MKQAKVVVVGAGPTGSACALTLAKLAPALAAETVVLEKARHPREKYCAGAVSCWGVSALERLGVGMQVPHVPIRGIAVRYGDRIATARGEGLGVVCRRIELDASLATAARRVVGEVREDARVVGVDRDGEGFVVRTQTDEVRAEVVIAADGAGSSVRKLLAFPEPRRKAHLYVLETPPSSSPAETEDSVITFDLTCVASGVQGYTWDFPTVIDGVPAVSRGIYHLNARRPAPGEKEVPVKEVLRAFLAHRGIDLDQVQLKAFAERGYVPGAEIARPGVLLAGEAAGVDPVTGEGIAQALVYGELAARTVADGFARRDLGFKHYGDAVRRAFVGRHLSQASRLAPHVYGGRARRWAEFLVAEPLAMQAGLTWYRGEPLGLATKARLAARLVRSVALG